jgi:hypothetical protein
MNSSGSSPGAGTRIGGGRSQGVGAAMEVDVMKMMVSVVAVMLATSLVAASAQNKPDVSVPSSQNSGAGIQGAPGNKNGPPAQKGTVGSAATSSQNDQTVKDQDSANVKGLPGNKSGPAPRKPQ